MYVITSYKNLKKPLVYESKFFKYASYPPVLMNIYWEKSGNVDDSVTDDDDEHQRTSSFLANVEDRDVQYIEEFVSNGEYAEKYIFL